MQEYVFTINGEDGKKYPIEFNDRLFVYSAYRSVLLENVCLEIISEIKKQSGKKVAIIFGNCQMQKLQDFLLSHKFFSSEYLILQLPPVFEYGNAQNLKYFQENFWSLCDLLISQRISNNNRFNPVLATQKIPVLIPENTKIIWVPNVYFVGYFPQQIKNLRNIGIGEHQSGKFPFGDKYVDAFFEKTVSERHSGEGVVTPFPNSSNISGRRILFQKLKFWQTLKNLLKSCENVSGLVIFICLILSLIITSGNKFVILLITQRKMLLWNFRAGF